MAGEGYPQEEYPYRPEEVPCPKCEALAQVRCRTLTTRRVTDYHEARWNALGAAQHEYRRARDAWLEAHP